MLVFCWLNSPSSLWGQLGFPPVTVMGGVLAPGYFAPFVAIGLLFASPNHPLALKVSGCGGKTSEECGHPT